MPSQVRFDNWLDSAGIARKTVLQVVHTLKTDPFGTNVSVTSGGVAVTGLGTSITPSSTNSKIFIFVDGVSGAAGGLSQNYFWLARGTTKIGAGADASNRVGIGSRHYYADSNVSGPFSLTFLDSPNTTSAVTYNLYMATQSGYFGYIGRTYNDTDNSVDQHRPSTRMTLFEIAG